MTDDPARLDEASASPFLIEFVMVQWGPRRLMAYLDEAGQWRTAYEHRKLPGRVQVLG